MDVVFINSGTIITIIRSNVGSSSLRSCSTCCAHASLMTRLLLSLVSRFTAVLQGMPSPLEIGACIAVVDVIEGNNYFQNALAVTSLFLAVCDWHVPRAISYDNFICRFLSAICMQALFPYSPTLTCLAFLCPTFGKRDAEHASIGARVSSLCFSYIGGR